MALRACRHHLKPPRARGFSLPLVAPARFPEKMALPEFVAPSANDAAAFLGDGWPSITPTKQMPRRFRRAFWLVSQDLKREDKFVYDLALMSAAEAITPTAQLKQQYLQDPQRRPSARLAEADRQSIRDSSALWVARSFERRKEAIDLLCPYAPPCLTCATPTEMGCRRCRQPVCGHCLVDGWGCHGCPPAIPRAEFERREAEAFTVSVRAADLDASPAELVQGM